MRTTRTPSSRPKPDDIVLTEKITGVPVAVIKTEYIERMGIEPGRSRRFLLEERPHEAPDAPLLQPAVGLAAQAVAATRQLVQGFLSSRQERRRDRPYRAGRGDRRAVRRGGEGGARRVLTGELGVQRLRLDAKTEALVVGLREGTVDEPAAVEDEARPVEALGAEFLEVAEDAAVELAGVRKAGALGPGTTFSQRMPPVQKKTNVLSRDPPKRCSKTSRN